MKALPDIEPVRELFGTIDGHPEPEQAVLRLARQPPLEAEIALALQEAIEMHPRVLEPLAPGAHDDDQRAAAGGLDHLGQERIDRHQRLEERIGVAEDLRERPVFGMAPVVEPPEGVQQLSVEVERQHPEVPRPLAEQNARRGAPHLEHGKAVFVERAFAAGRVGVPERARGSRAP